MVVTDTISIDPDPRILEILSFAQLKPMDALSELIDNSIDAFLNAERAGNKVENPNIQIQVPSRADVARGGGAFIFLDNGPGLDLESARNALRAGFSSQNQFDSLGLFGVGFNIASGKIGSRTMFKTSQSSQEPSIELTIDLNALRQQTTFNIPVTANEEELSFTGTMVQISNWHPKGHISYGFALSISSLGLPRIRREIGRRYYSLMKDTGINIYVNNERCVPYEHCVWDSLRTVDHGTVGTVPARIDFDSIIHSEKRCKLCQNIVDGDTCLREECEDNVDFRTIDERIKGWVGIQRFDSTDEFGIDLIRNGRVIRRFEKEPFFSWENASGNLELEYPIDPPSGSGRIVGEVHIDHVPVDFTKQDFNRYDNTSWTRAIRYLRGPSGLRPEIAAANNEPINSSPIWKLFQAYRRADAGPRGMFMVEWDSPDAVLPKRASGDKIKEFRERFNNKEQGYLDDTLWWEEVTKGPPVQAMEQCGECGTQYLTGADECPGCGCIFNGKNCIDPECNEVIALSAVECQRCGTSQEIEIGDPWQCLFCHTNNPPSNEACSQCSRSKGEQNPISQAYLLENSSKDEGLSIEGFNLPLPDEAQQMIPIDMTVYTMNSGRRIERNGERYQCISFTGGSSYSIFVDGTHDYFTTYQQSRESAVSMELARYVQNSNLRFMGGENSIEFSLPVLSWRILSRYYSETLLIDREKTRDNCQEFFRNLTDHLPDLLGDVVADISASLSNPEKNKIVERMLQHNHDAGLWAEFRENGQFLLFIERDRVLRCFEEYTEKFFDNNFWKDTYTQLDPDIGTEGIDSIKKHLRSRYQTYLQEVLSFLDNTYAAPDINITRRVNNSLDLLLSKRVVF